MPICSFSGEEIPPGQGIMYVKKDGKVLWFRNGKAEKNYLKLGRKPRNVTWTGEARAAKEAAMAAGKKEEKTESTQAADGKTASEPAAGRKGAKKPAAPKKAASKAAAKKAAKGDAA